MQITTEYSGRWLLKIRIAWCFYLLGRISTLKMEAACYSEALVLLTRLNGVVTQRKEQFSPL